MLIIIWGGGSLLHRRPDVIAKLTGTSVDISAEKEDYIASETNKRDCDWIHIFVLPYSSTNGWQLCSASCETKANNKRDCDWTTSLYFLIRRPMAGSYAQPHVKPTSSRGLHIIMTDGTRGNVITWSAHHYDRETMQCLQTPRR